MEAGTGRGGSSGPRCSSILGLDVCVSLSSMVPPGPWATSRPSPSASVKFINKIQYVHSLEDLEQLIPMEHVQIPDVVLQ